MKRVISVSLGIVMLVATLGAGLDYVPEPATLNASAQTPQGQDLPVVEYLNRGIVSAAIRGNGRFVSWRFLASDPVDTTFRLYRGDTLIYTSDPGEPTNFTDTAGTATSAYRVDAVANGIVFDSQDKVIRANNHSNTPSGTPGGAYFDIPLTAPPRGQFADANNTIEERGHHPNDIAVGDVDGDGEYELFLKWDANNSKDAAQDGATNNTYIECIKLDGTSLWRIDLGPNIRSGAHDTQMLVADYQLNGSAQLIVKTADGTIDGLGNRIGSTAIHRNSAGRVLAGDEFLTLFCGKTGEALDTIPYKPGRGTVNQWGSPIGNSNGNNRVNRYLGAVAYLDGVRPSAVTIRGYYTRLTATAYDVVDNKLVEKWAFDTGHTPSHPAYGQGNHNVMPAAVHEGSHKQSLFLGASAIRYDGELLWSSGRGHGDALHVGNFIPGRTQSNGIQVFSCFETSPYGLSLFDGLSGTELWRQTGTGDTARCMAGNFVRGNNGAEFWGSGDMRNINGERLGNTPNSTSFAIWWSGELERQLLNTTGGNEGWMRIDRATNTNGGLERVFTAESTSINGTKANPNISADLFGDWREQLIMRNSDKTTNVHSLRVYTTVTPTTHRITTLMHDPHYRMQVAGQNICYNQPPTTSFYLGTGQPLPPQPDVTVRGSTPAPEPCEQCGEEPCECPPLCDICEKEPCECPPPCEKCGKEPCECEPVIMIVRLSINRPCNECEVIKTYQVTAILHDEVPVIARLAAKRDTSGNLLQPCPNSMYFMHENIPITIKRD
ncbi:MAG: rhamnogalacturonan lyase [Oscillospiraceae bacterium]|nr:rhamnogalacturonan lyase [Oscillospiraceae bacterium]